MKLYNTLTRKKEEFKPIEEGKAKIYLCGPTVYNFIHIGNARPFVVFDTLRRFMEFLDYKVEYVQNFTDIDDKIITEANKEDIQASVIAEKFINEFLKDANGLNIQKATYYPKVTEEVEGIIEMIKDLTQKGFAYEVEGSVYFRANKANNYGKLSKKNIEDLEAGARVAANTDKENPSDFALWKLAKEGEPHWDSPWGKGRPGWHIECSLMAKKYLGETIDIHAGGEDLCFPHHENEIAQSEAYSGGKTLANYWLHNGMIMLDNQKMSKSEGNSFFVRDIAEEFSYATIRFFILSAHYRSPLNYSKELVEAAQNGLRRIENCIDNLERALLKEDIFPDKTNEIAEVDFYFAKFVEEMNDDINTANAIAALFYLVRFANTKLNTLSHTEIKHILKKIELMFDILGIQLNNNSNITNEDEINVLIEERNAAKADKNWVKADEIRETLLKMGIEIKDTREGTIWQIK